MDRQALAAGYNSQVPEAIIAIAAGRNDSAMLCDKNKFSATIIKGSSTSDSRYMV